MNTWRGRIVEAGRKLRGIVGLSFFGGAISGTIGALIGAVGSALSAMNAGVSPFSWMISSVMALGFGFFVFGAVGTAGFATLLAVTSWRIGSVGEIRLLNAAALGALAGFVAPVIFMLPWIGFSEIGRFVVLEVATLSVTAALTGGLATALVSAAKRADRRELESGAADVALEGGSQSGPA